MIRHLPFIADQTTDNQLQGFELYLVEDVGGTEDVVTTPPTEDNNIYTFSFTPPRNVSAITIKRPSANVIVICELQALASISTFFFTTELFFRGIVLSTLISYIYLGLAASVNVTSLGISH